MFLFIQVVFVIDYIIPFYQSEEYGLPSFSQLYNLSQAYINDQLEPIKDDEEDEDGEE